MNVIYGILLAGILVVGGYGYYIVTKKTTDKVQARYLACIERGADSQSCMIEEMSLRALQSCPK